MGTVDLKALIAKKQEDRMKTSELVLKDINRELITALLALPIYGKDARDEDILTIIINGGIDTPLLKKWRDRVQAQIESGEIKKQKGGDYRDADGFMVLIPR